MQSAGKPAPTPTASTQENNSFFAYQPILAALQGAAGRTLPLAQYLAPAEGAQPRDVEVLAYLADARRTLSLTKLCDEGKLRGLPELEAQRWVAGWIA